MGAFVRGGVAHKASPLLVNLRALCISSIFCRVSNARPLSSFIRSLRNRARSNAIMYFIELVIDP